MNVTEYIKQNLAKEFRSEPVYFPTGDFLTYLIKDGPYIAERLDDVTTLYLAWEDRSELVGFKLKGVLHILKKAGAFGVGVGDGQGIRLGVFSSPAPPRTGPTR